MSGEERFYDVGHELGVFHHTRFLEGQHPCDGSSTRRTPSSCYPKTISVDQGSQFISRDLDLWAYHKGVVLDFSRPGKPTDNAFIESFNGKFRAEWASFDRVPELIGDSINAPLRPRSIKWRESRGSGWTI